MVDPFDITNFNRSNAELEEFFVFAVCVAGKNADRTAKAVEAFLGLIWTEREAPLAVALRRHDRYIRTCLEKARIGQYDRITSALRAYATRRISLRHCTLEDLESLHGVGPKTARFFVLHTRPGQRCIPLDTHLLKRARELGHNAPKNTPPAGRRYRELEEVLLRDAETQGLPIAEYDLQTWTRYAASA